MERITLRSRDTGHENGVCCTHFKSKECLEVGGNCAYGCKWEEAAWEKLAEYEDSLMSPKQCAESMKLTGLLNQYHGVTVERVVELIEADKAGMSIIPPCKPGDKLFALTSDSLTGIEETRCTRIVICNAADGLYAKVIAPCGYDDGTYAHWEFTEADFGTKVFLNQEDAEKAWRKNELQNKGMSFYSER